MSSSIKRCGIAVSQEASKAHEGEHITSCEPNGATCCHLKTSLASADTYGNFGSSSNVGKRSVPMTRSISSCAFAWAAGFINMARKKVNNIDTVWKIGSALFVSECDGTIPYRRQLWAVT